MMYPNQTKGQEACVDERRTRVITQAQTENPEKMEAEPDHLELI